MTCRRMPEQYGAYEGEQVVGYVRLRYGFFSVEFPDVGGTEVFRHQFPEPMKGEFDTEEERKEYLGYAERALEVAALMAARRARSGRSKGGRP